MPEGILFGTYFTKGLYCLIETGVPDKNIRCCGAVVSPGIILWKIIFFLIEFSCLDTCIPYAMNVYKVLKLELIIPP